MTEKQTLAPSVTGVILVKEPASLAAAYTAAVAAGEDEVEVAETIAIYAGWLGQEIRARAATLAYRILRAGDDEYAGLVAEEGVVEAELKRLQGIPALRAAIDAVSQEDVDSIWREHGPPEPGDARYSPVVAGC